MITLTEAKLQLKVKGDEQDDYIQSLLSAAKHHALEIMNRQSLRELVDEQSRELPRDVQHGIYALLNANWQSCPETAEQYLAVAEFKLQPFRCGIGV